MALSEKARAARNAYMRQRRANWTPEQKARAYQQKKDWLAAHPGRQQAYMNRYWERRADKMGVDGGDQ